MTYAAMLAELFAARRLGVRFELARVEAALAGLGDPQRRIGQVVHVGGTNGKGSTAAFVEAILRAGGSKTGLYTSPHLCRFTERVRVGGREVDREALAERYARVREVAGELTFFEQATILALATFADAGTEVAVLEVGLGGRLDATNVVRADVAIVTGVAFDHMEILGGTLEAIAGEKAGIFKQGRGAVIGRSGLAEGVPLLEAAARRAGCDPVRIAPPIPPNWILGVPGAYQRANAACAVAAVGMLPLRRGIDERTCREGLAAARWPGRMETIQGVLCDAAHNPHGARALAEELATHRGRIFAVVGISSDKDAAAVAAPVARLAETVWATEAPTPRALAAHELAGRVGGAIAEPDPARALAAARAKASRPGDLVVVFGSLFLVGAARAMLTGEPVDPIVAQDPAASGRP